MSNDACEKDFKMPDYCQGFTYPIPIAFCDALVSCRFEQGDVLYSDAIAYEKTWGEAVKSLSYTIQITAPTRGTTTGTADKQREGKKSPDQQFRDNWETEVSFELTNVKTSEKVNHTVTQGQLYTALRTGNLQALEDSTEPPFGIRDANHLLPELPLKSYADDGKKSFAFFGLTGTEALKQKLDALNVAFNGLQPRQTHVNDILELQDKDMNPLLELFVYALDLTEDEIDAAAKSTLYKASKEKKTDRENWRLATHGYLE